MIILKNYIIFLSDLTDLSHLLIVKNPKVRKFQTHSSFSQVNSVKSAESKICRFFVKKMTVSKPAISSVRDKLAASAPESKQVTERTFKLTPIHILVLCQIL